MEKDSVYQILKQDVSRETNINQIEVDKVLDKTFKGLNELLTSGVERVKIPYLGTFRKKKNLLTENGSNIRFDNTGGGNTDTQSRSKEN